VRLPRCGPLALGGAVDPDREHPDHYLLDLACGAGMLASRLVGHASGDDYVFKPA